MKLVRIRSVLVTIEVPDSYPFQLVSGEKVIAGEIKESQDINGLGRVLEVSKGHVVPMFNQVPQLEEKINNLKRHNKQLGVLLVCSPFLYFIATTIFRLLGQP